MAKLPAYNALTRATSISGIQDVYSFLAANTRTLRPWANVWIPAASGGGQWIVDMAKYPPTERFRYLKSFRWTMYGGPEAVRINLFDDRGHTLEALHNVYSTYALKRDMTTIGQFFIGFKFGWSFDQGDGVEQTIASEMHWVLLTDISVMYTDGGVSYQLTATDPVASAQLCTCKTPFHDVTFMNAVQMLLSDASMGQKFNVQFGTGGGGEKDDTAPKDSPPMHWHVVGHDKLKIVRGWMQTHGVVKAKNGDTLDIWMDTVKNVVVIAGKKSINKTATMLGYGLGGPHVVNAWAHGGAFEMSGSLSKTGTIVTRFEPQISGLGALTQAPQIFTTSPDVREIFDSIQSRQASGRIGNAQSTLHAQGRAFDVLGTPPADRPIHVNTEADIIYDRRNRVLSSFQPNETYVVNAELEMIGWPKIDLQEQVIARYIKLIVIDPYGIDDLSPEWVSQGPNPYLSGSYLVQKFEHVIDEATGYRVVATLTRGRNSDTQGMGDPN